MYTQMERMGKIEKNSSDIELCIDAIESTYKDPNITCYVFVTADSDMIPILSRMMYKGKRVELYYLSDAAPKYVDMSTYVHHCEDLIDFLKIERKSYDVNDYIVSALQIIKDWEQKFGNSDKFLGATWLKGELSKRLELPELFVSDLIERLQVEKLIADGKKTLTTGQIKNTISLSELGNKLLDTNAKEVAASLEKQKN